MRKLAGVVLAAALVASGAYFVVYLYAWEWYRAYVTGTIFVAAEVAMAALLLSARRGSRVAGPAAPHHGEAVVRELLSETPPGRRNPFAWMEPDRFGVFIPLLVGSGFVLSALAWAVERAATAFYGEQLDDRLARQVATLLPPVSLLDRPSMELLLGTPGYWTRGVLAGIER